MSKFGTTSSNLFNNKIDAKVPNWMSNLCEDADRYVNDKTVDIEFDNKIGAFAANKINQRENLDATPRDTVAGLNNQKLIIDSKIELAKFLNNKYYKTNVRIAGNTAYMDTIIDGVQANFTFEYNFVNGRVKQAATFIANESEYPFSKAGFQECLDDIKEGTLKKSQTKIASSREAYVINREEIIRRYNGSIREASDTINTYLNKGMIVGAGSNSYATYYNPDEIFPKMEKEIPFDKLGSFEYVKNTEHVATNEHKSANNLSIEASKILANIFNDYSITNIVRDNNELLVKATVLNNNGKKCDVNFNFDIKNEKVASLMLAEIDDKRMSVKDLLKYINNDNDLINKFLNNKSASKRIYNGTIISQRELKTQLARIISKDKIDDFVEGLIQLGALKHINNTTFASNYTIPDLLGMMSCETISDNEIDQIIEYSKKYNNNMNRVAQKDTGIRDMEEEVTEKSMLYSANNFISQHFRNYHPVKFASLNNKEANYTIKLFDETSGLSTNIDFKINFDGNKVVECKANINNSLVELNNVKTAFAKNEILNKYLQVTEGIKTDAPIIITCEDLTRRLQKISNITKNEVKQLIDNWENTNRLIKLNTNMYGSKYTIEQLISMSNIKPLSDEEISEKLLRGKLNKNLTLTASYIKNSDTRAMEEKWSTDRMVIHAKDEIGTMFKDFDIVDAELNNNGYSVVARLINPFNGSRIALKFNFNKNGEKLSKIASISNGIKTVNGNQIIELLNEKNEVIDTFNKFNGINKNSGKIVISSNNLKTKLVSVIDNNKYNDIINVLVENNIITPISKNNFVSECSLNDIVGYLQDNNLIDIKTASIKLSSYSDKSVVDLRGPKVYDTDNRTLEAPEKKLSPAMENTANKLRKIIISSLNNKKITNNKSNQLNDLLNSAKTPSDIEKVWSELKKYI